MELTLDNLSKIIIKHSLHQITYMYNNPFQAKIKQLYPIVIKMLSE
ncbi:hypothetical protein D593_1060 [Streptococcus intermedius BA1]|nr:hypothetical protein D593_1060 [Streptococcus intermedius BA1]